MSDPALFFLGVCIFFSVRYFCDTWSSIETEKKVKEK